MVSKIFFRKFSEFSKDYFLLSGLNILAKPKNPKEISGSSARLEFIEIKGVTRKAFDLRVTDPMACDHFDIGPQDKGGATSW